MAEPTPLRPTELRPWILNVVKKYRTPAGETNLQELYNAVASLALRPSA